MVILKKDINRVPLNLFMSLFRTIELQLKNRENYKVIIIDLKGDKIRGVNYTLICIIEFWNLKYVEINRGTKLLLVPFIFYICITINIQHYVSVL